MACAIGTDARTCDGSIQAKKRTRTTTMTSASTITITNANDVGNSGEVTIAFGGCTWYGQ